MTDKPIAICELCGFPIPHSEEMFRYHGYSGPCPTPPTREQLEAAFAKADADSKQLRREATPDRNLLNEPCTI